MGLARKLDERRQQAGHLRADREGQAVVAAAVAERLERGDDGQRIMLAAAVGAGHIEAEQPETSTRGPGVARKRAIVVPRDDVDVQRMLGERDHALAQVELFRGSSRSSCSRRSMVDDAVAA